MAQNNKVVLVDNLAESGVDTRSVQGALTSYAKKYKELDKDIKLPFHGIMRKVTKFIKKYNEWTVSLRFSRADHIALTRLISGLTSKTNITQKSEYSTNVGKGKGYVGRTSLKQIPTAIKQENGYVYDSEPIIGKKIFRSGVHAFTADEIIAKCGIDETNAASVGTYTTMVHAAYVRSDNAYFKKSSVRDGTKWIAATSSIRAYIVFTGAASWIKDSPTSDASPPGHRCVVIANILKNNKGDTSSMDDAVEKLGNIHPGLKSLAKDQKFQNADLEHKYKMLEEKFAKKVLSKGLEWSPPAVLPMDAVVIEGDKIRLVDTLARASGRAYASMRDTYYILSCLGVLEAETYIIRSLAPNFVRQFIIGQHIREANVEKFDHNSLQGSYIVRFPLRENASVSDNPVRCQKFGSSFMGTRFTTETNAESTNRTYGRKRTSDGKLKKQMVAKEFSMNAILFTVVNEANVALLEICKMAVPTHAYYVNSNTEPEDIIRKKTAVQAKEKAVARSTEINRKREERKQTPMHRLANVKHVIGQSNIGLGTMINKLTELTSYDEMFMYLKASGKNRRTGVDPGAQEIVGLMLTMFQRFQEREMHELFVEHTAGIRGVLLNEMSRLGFVDANGLTGRGDAVMAARVIAA